MKKAKALNKMISRRSSAIQIPKNRATTARIQTTRLLVKLECLEIILFNAGSGCSLLGLMYEEGKGVKQDDFKAVKFFQKACDLNNGTFWKNLTALKSSCLTPLPSLYINPRLEQPPQVLPKGV
jgi:hypothetical protein